MIAHGFGVQAFSDGQVILEKIDRAPERHQRGPSGFQPQKLWRCVVRKQLSQRTEGLGASVLAAAAVVPRAVDRDIPKDGAVSYGAAALSEAAAE